MARKFGVVACVAQQLARGGEVTLALVVTASQAADVADLGVLARQGAVTPVVGGHSRIGQSGVELLQAVAQAVDRGGQ